MKICLLASGSKGNSILVESGKTRLLIDAGLSARELRKRLDSVDVEAESLDALLITHEHGDHVRGLGPLVRQLDLPVYLQTDLARKLPDVGKPECVQEFVDGEEFTIKDLTIRPFAITHDCLAPVGFTLDGELGKVGVATDLGIVTRLVTECLQDCRALVLETNHDEELLRDGPYPWKLKQRVRSNHGHLSNNAAGNLLQSLLWNGLETVFLGHLSETNNRPDLAVEVVREVLEKQNICEPQVLLGKQQLPVLWAA
ncbi:MAG: MBL fold metallo-hydrolase [Desulfuromonadales bacterium]|jgi:phosphoribosyl 1,2-cyclic phosphodiesterase|nr:MBL fold metallo-hydrolase [Desulfuromonadales bacterium]MDH3807431.1 MBL fold metallo-hydrolase [Desulfuromonadales bacterium]MDH3869130.1 MBL fold metallo-hydrolase [Desulfuromonadales bacterium]MDH3960215.1 MBL fold metallo-hydrolase [Desulfuromonadales bacterium]MDH4027098.1 MBL fold metallo-hydrolase [Desulfuromonadales bacterium]